MANTIRRFDPISEIQRMNEMFDRIFGGPIFNPTTVFASTQGFTIPLDVVEKEDKLVVRAAVPGVAPEDLNVSIENNVLTISGEIKKDEESENDKVYFRECCYGNFSRSIRLGDNLDFEKVDAEFSNGNVIISIPKIPEEKPKTVKVAVRSKK